MPDDQREAENWILHDINSNLKPVKETLFNSKWLAKTSKHLQAKGEHKHASKLITATHGVLQEKLLPVLVELRTLEPLPPQEFPAAFDCLAQLPGFEGWEAQFNALKQRIEYLQGRGNDLRKHRSQFHAAILSEDGKIAEEFARRYLAVLQSCNVLNSDENAIRADGNKNKALYQAHSCGMCLIQNAEELSGKAKTKLSTRMRTEDIIFVVNYTESKYVSTKFLKTTSSCVSISLKHCPRTLFR